MSLAGGKRQLRLDAQEENWELEDLEQLQGELCGGLEEGRREDGGVVEEGRERARSAWKERGR